MAIGYVIPVDPAELANRYSTSDDPYEEPDDEKVESLITSGYAERIEPLLARIPVRERDLINLYYIQRKRQADMAEIFGVTQAAISYRLDRALQRIKFLLSIPQMTESDLRTDLPLIFKEIDVNILVGMWDTTCQSEVAERLGLTQGRVRHRFFKAVKTLEKAAEQDAKFAPYHKLFFQISQNFNAVREVCLPQWKSRGTDEIL